MKWTQLGLDQKLSLNNVRSIRRDWKVLDWTKKEMTSNDETYILFRILQIFLNTKKIKKFLKK